MSTSDHIQTDGSWRVERLAAASEKAGGDSELGRKIGHQNGAQVGHMLKGRRPITEKTIQKIEAIRGFEGWFSRPASTEQVAPESPHANVALGPDLKGEVPLISWVKAGTWGEAADPFQPGEAESWLDCPVKHSKATYALRVRGDSMTAPSGNSRTYPEGCVIFVDPEKRSPVNGDRVIAKLKGTAEVTFKVYKNEDGRQWLQPLNPSHEPIREEFKILGKVLGKWEDG